MRIRVKRQHLFYGMIFASFSMIAILTTFLFSPTAGSHADSVNIGVGVNSVISLSMPDSSIMMNASPNSFVSATIDPTVFTNSSFGYTLRMSAFDSKTSMESESVDNEITSSFGGSKTSDSMPSNAWGYSLDGTNYARIPVEIHAKNISISNGPSPDGGSTAEVRIGAKIGMIPSGTYHGKLIFTAYVNGVDGTPDPDDPDWEGEDEGDPEDDYDDQGNCTTTKTLYDINTMQRMTPCICANTTTPTISARSITWSNTTATNVVPRKVLKDKRDNNKYLVSKLADGNCWMSTNLNMELSTSTTLTNALTDLNTKTSWTPDQNTTVIAGGSVGYVDKIYFNEDWASDPTVARSGRITEIGAYYKNDATASTEPTSTADSYLHERSGVYYNLLAASAGSSLGVTGDLTSVPDSICPKGWTLPSATKFENLFVKYQLRNQAPARLFLEAEPFNILASGRLYGTSLEYGQPIKVMQRQRSGELLAGSIAEGKINYLSFSGDSYQTMFISSDSAIWAALATRCIAR